MTRPIEKRIHITLPETPKGEPLIKRVLELSMRALTETYPILLDPPFSDKIPTRDRICFSSLDEIRKQQEEDKPSSTSKLLFLGMELAGIPKPAIKEKYHPLDKDYPVYWNLDSEKPTMYFSDEVRANLDSPDPDIRRTKALNFGITLIRETLEMLPVPQKLTCQAEWKEMIGIDLADGFFTSLEREFTQQIDPGKFAILKESADELPALDPKAQAVSCGAIVSLLFDGQTLNTAEYNMGSQFQDGIINYLATDVIQEFFTLMKKAQITPGSTRLADFLVNVLEPSEANLFAVKILRDMQLVDFRNKKELLELYLNSDLPTCYHESPKQDLVNPWQYPH